MTSFFTVNPDTTSVDRIERPDLVDVYDLIGLRRHAVDHGTLAREEDNSTLAIVVGEYGLFKPKDQIKYFSIHGQLFAGPAVLYAADSEGETIDLDVPPAVLFFRDADEVEKSIASGVVVRPIQVLGDKVFWKWPEHRNVAGEQAAIRQSVDELIKQGGGAIQVDDSFVIITPKDKK
jgi:hypothetical protein